jgi:hypothetical protein
MKHVMDELPDLRSDADVDALMARLRARIDSAPATPSAGVSGTTASPAPDLRDLLAAQETFASTVVLAMELMVDTLEEVTAEVEPAPVVRRARRQRAGRRRGR